jgi:hypothetical protein
MNGLDIDPASRTAKGCGFAFRIYGGGLPSEDTIRSALLEAQRTKRAEPGGHAPSRAGRTALASYAALASQRYRRVKLLPANPSLCFCCKPCRKRDSLNTVAALSYRCVRSVHRLRFLSFLAERAMQPKAEFNQFRASLALSVFRVRFAFLSTSIRERRR